MRVFEIVTVVIAIVFTLGWTLGLLRPYFWELPPMLISYWTGIVYFVVADTTQLHLWWYMPAVMVFWSVFGLVFRRGQMELEDDYRE